MLRRLTTWLCVISCALGALACDRSRPDAAQRETQKPAPQRQQVVLPAARIGPNARAVSIADVVERVLPSVVSIASARRASASSGSLPLLDDPMLRRFLEPFGFEPFGPGSEPPIERGIGSGVVVSRDGVVITSSHVVQNADEISLTTPDGKSYDAKVVGSDPKSDLAVIRVNEQVELRPIQIGDSSRLRLGDVVVAIGNPFGVGQTVTMGIVSATGRANLGIVDYEDFIQTDAAINPGNSGGALVNMDGELVGINTAILSRSGGYMGIGFAVPSNMTKPIMQSLLEHGKVVRGHLGVVIQDIDRNLAEALKLPSADGVLVADVEPGSPAARAGIERGDVVLAIDGEAVDDSGRLRNEIAAAGPGVELELRVLRSGKQQTIRVQLAEMPMEPAPPVEPDPSERAPGASVNGLEVAPLTPQTRARFRVPRQVDHGVVVVSVLPSGAAARAGLRPGDVLIEIGGQTVSSVADLERLWSTARGKTPLLVARAGSTVYLVLER